ncbi:hypothetical protein YC2023_052858 [Brassica napus]
MSSCLTCILLPPAKKKDQTQRQQTKTNKDFKHTFACLQGQTKKTTEALTINQ